MSKYKKDKELRPTFYYKDDMANEIRAGGMIFYKVSGNDISFLMIKTRGKFEDFGGCTDITDKTIQHTIAREVDEESNSIFKKNKIMAKMLNVDGTYTKRSKYLLYLTELETKDVDIDVDSFGSKEYHDNIDRTVEWVSYKNLKKFEFINARLHFRLRFKEFFDAITTLYNNKIGLAADAAMC